MSKRVLIFTLLMIIFVIDIGYAKNVDSIQVMGTSNSDKNFKIDFESANIESSVGANRNNTFIKISQDKKSIVLNVSNLYYPGAEVKFSTIVKNNGLIPAKVESINVTGLRDNSPLKIKVLDTDKDIIEANEKTKVLFVVKWDENWNTRVDETANFKIDLNYIQAY